MWLCINSLTALLTTAYFLQTLRCLTVPLDLILQNEAIQRTDPSSLRPIPNSLESIRNPRETLKEAAIHARELIQYRSQGIGTLISNYPSNHPDKSLRGQSIGLQEYFAPFPNGDLLLLVLPISPIYKNIDRKHSHSATIAIKDELGLIQRNGSMWAANWRRISLFGQLDPIKNKKKAKKLYESFHPDSSFWDGDSAPHKAFWVRFKITKVYYFGGFGDRAAIGWLDLKSYRTSFKESEENKARSICFHKSGPNLYCEQPGYESEDKYELGNQIN
ncbi:hypothetical protein CROQUDRAFT_663089 [Cronartium quercuum f. sp. fusiforme G11]|uniref:CREG-like beta-barrel domain-containing protein n=1 Tax=Cronartium quercuum f. sp. fusiforme G11 TaxID=708437 RepID=A0A9P6T7Z8_9BASI|nr:hypothetical protein CROQUDRAFT_663089 [Cronartium quercuum f. sp. fusiforme G11]